MRLTLLATQALPAEAPAMARLSWYATNQPLSRRDPDAMLLDAAGAPAGTPVAPLAALGAGFDPADAYVLRADPVTLVAGRDDVMLAGRVDDLAAEDAAAIVRTLGAHFAADGLAFHAARPDAWFVTARERVPVDADTLEPEEPIQPHLPRGDHASTWRRWLSEMQMLLHDHAVNASREAAGKAPVTGIWISGGGVAPRSLDVHASIEAPAGRAGDVARGLASMATPANGADAIAIASNEGDALRRIAEALAALEGGTLAELVVVANGTRLRATRPSWWRRMRAPKA